MFARESPRGPRRPGPWRFSHRCRFAARKAKPRATSSSTWRFERWTVARFDFLLRAAIVIIRAGACLHTFHPGNLQVFWLGCVRRACAGPWGEHENQRKDADAGRCRNPLPTLRCADGSGNRERTCLRGPLPLRRQAPDRSRRPPPSRRGSGQPGAGGAQRTSSLRSGDATARASVPALAQRRTPISVSSGSPQELAPYLSRAGSSSAVLRVGGWFLVGGWAGRGCGEG